MTDSSAKEPPEQRESKNREPIRWLLMGLLLALLGMAFFVVFRPFVRPVSWAAIVALGAWPLHSRVRAKLPNWPGLAATVSSVLMVVIVLGGLVPVLRGLGPELKTATSSLTEYVEANQHHLADWASSLPVVGERISEEALNLQQVTENVVPLLQEYAQTLLGTASVAAQGLAWLLFDFFFFCISVFFLFYYGETLAGQLQSALKKVDDETERLIVLVEKTVTGVLYGIVFTAIAQGLLAGIGFAIAGARAPILLGLTTMFFAVIPFGPPIVYIPVSVAFVIDGHPIRGLILALWGFLLVSSADNVLKPYFIARQAKLPLPLVLIGVSGGVLGFGVIGVFVGPVVMGLMRSLWLGWVNPEEFFEQQEEPAAPSSETDEQNEDTGTQSDPAESKADDSEATDRPNPDVEG